MDIPRTDSPVCGFEFPSSAPLTCPSPGWIRALPSPDTKPYCSAESDEHDLCSEAEADLASLVHHLDLSIYSGFHNPPSLRFSFSSRASCSSTDSLSTIGYTPRSSILHTPTSSMDFNQFNRRSLPKSRSLASVALSPAARRAAVYIIDDEDVEEAYGGGKISYDMEMGHAEEEEEEKELHDNPPSRFSIDEEERPLNFGTVRTFNLPLFFGTGSSLSAHVPRRVLEFIAITRTLGHISPEVTIPRYERGTRSRADGTVETGVEMKGTWKPSGDLMAASGSSVEGCGVAQAPAAAFSVSS
ncbi:hypothetical protein CPB85DRAFT_1249523 [Mucidula mucida]|nr:hypothetical protein CPB85DRAFT_1249523 [Mucidula mucida]